MNADYRKGFEDGIRCFAWWKDGVQMVGTCGTTLERALAGVENRHGFNPPASSAPANTIKWSDYQDATKWASNEKPTCGACKKTMTPENSTVAPEMFLCDECAKLHGYAPRRSWRSISGC